VSHNRRLRRLVISLIAIPFTILLWAIFFYAPYSWYMTLIAWALGKPPDFASEATFSLLVLAGNQLMFVVCDWAASWIAYRNTDHEQAVYIRFYTIAILANLAADMYILYTMTHVAIVTLGVRSSASPAITTALHDSLSRNLFEYNVPGCFLLPAILEPIVVVVLPCHIGAKLVGTRHVSQETADSLLAAPAMDLCRYAEILLNITQATLALCLDSGYVLWTFVGLFCGQLLTYFWDHWRVLREVESFHFSSPKIEKLAQMLTAIPCATLAVNVASHTHSVHECIIVFAVHLVVHWFILKTVVPCISRGDRLQKVKRPYRDVAQEIPANYFNVNPVHCLRSKYVHHHEPPCVPYVRGKEHLLRVNPDLGLFYHAARWDNRGKGFMEMVFVDSARKKKRRHPEKKSVCKEIVCDRIWKLNKDVAEGTPAHASLQSWRRRLFFLSEIDTELNIEYASEKDGKLVVACPIVQSEFCAKVDELGEVLLDPPSPKSSEIMKVRLQIYEKEISRWFWAHEVDKVDDLPATLFTFVIRWGQQHSILGCESAEDRDRWILCIREHSYFLAAHDCEA